MTATPSSGADRRSETGIRYIRHTGEPAVFKAGWIIKDPWTVMENAGVAMARGRITDILTTVPKDRSVNDCGPGILMPCLVNAHLHLELSALAGRLPLGKGFAPWVAALLEEREAIGIPALIRAAKAAVQALPGQGTGPVGEISTLGITRALLSDQVTPGVWFREYLGTALPEPDLSLVKEFPLSVSAAGHAPHTTSPDLLTYLKHRTKNAGLVFSIHVAESDVEREFLAGDNPQWHDFLIQRGIDPTGWPVGNKTPVGYLNDLGILGPDTLAVHLLQVTDTDLDLLADTKTRICLCPRSNVNLHGRFPDIPAMLNRGLTPALGTDSLASCESLSLFDEMAFVQHHRPDVSPADIFAMATKNGTQALGLADRFGTLDPGKRSEFIYLEQEASSRNQVLEKAVSYGTR
jgi:cytosine/adenosine deaminase-related metal-dependent hydrolase